MTEINIPLNLKDGTTIDGSHPLVIVGPNGSGKTTFGAELANRNNAEWVGATRNLEFGDAISMQTPEQSRQQLIKVKKQTKSKPWGLSNELNNLLSKLKAEDADSAIKYRNQSIIDSSAAPERTKIIELTHLWNSIFPGREIDFSSYNPSVKAGHRNNAAVNISRMSGGERVALYLLARVLDADAGVVFIDEPELHFHSVLAKRFWSEMENIRSDCRFVYITHDLPFAISRKNVQFIIIPAFDQYSVLSLEESIPPEVVESIIGAATFSISAKRIVFCEGARYNQRDDSIYSSWFSGEHTAVIPVGSCEDVVKCVEVFNNNPVVNGVRAIGLLDRDYWPDDYLEGMPSEVHVLPVHEVESLICIQSVFIALAKQVGLNASDANSKYTEFLESAKNKFSGLFLNKQVLERVKRKTELSIRGILNQVPPHADVEHVKISYTEALNVENWGFSPDQIFEEETIRLNSALSSNNEEFLKLFPGKAIHGLAAEKMGISTDRVYALLSSALNIPDEPERQPSSSAVLLPLKNDLIAALNEILPLRTYDCQ